VGYAKISVKKMWKGCINMRKKRIMGRTAAVLFCCIFLFNDLSHSLNFPPNNLSAPKLIFHGESQEPPTESFKNDIREVEKDAARLELFLSIGKYFLSGSSPKKVVENMAKTSDEFTQKCLEQGIIKIEGNESEAEVIFSDGDCFKKIRIRKNVQGRSEPGWNLLEKYEFLIGKLGKDETMKSGGNSFLGQIKASKKSQDPKMDAVQKIVKLVLEGNTSDALKLFFTSEAFQGKNENLDVPAGIFNRLLTVFEQYESQKEALLEFTHGMIKFTVEFSGDSEEAIEVAQAVQKMAGLVLMLPEGLRFTVEENNMVQNGKRGKSFINVNTLSDGIEEVKEETIPGFYWRGVENVSKIRPENIMKFAIYNTRRFAKLTKILVQYVMLHGGRKINDQLKENIKKRGLSNPHETLFVNGILPSSFQPTSTGPGHFQIKKMDGKLVGLLDVKQINRGEYIQVNAKYNTEGKIVKVVCQKVKKNEICFSAPGWRDYMIDIGGYGLEGFNDFSVPVSAFQSKLFDPDFKEDELGKIEKALENKKDEDFAPYGALIFNGEPVLVKMNEEFPEAQWVHVPENKFSNINFFEMYEKILDSREGSEFISILGELCSKAKKEAPIEVLSLSDAKIRAEKEIKNVEDNAASLGMTKGIYSFIDSCASLFGGVKKKAGIKKLIRIPVEVLENIGVEDSEVLLKRIQDNKTAAEKFYIKLFSSKKPLLEVGTEAYEKFGIKNETLPFDFKMSRANTITLFPVDKGEEFPARLLNIKWDRLRYSEDGILRNLLLETAISPVGYNYDQSGLARGVFFGMILSEISANEEYTKDSSFVLDFVKVFKELYLSGGNDPDRFDLTAEDIINISRGEINALVKSLNKLIKILPIMPVNVNEQREIYEYAREAWIRA